MNNVDQDSQGHLYVLSPRGYSAYEVAVQQGFVGTEDEWLESLVGPQGETGLTPSLSIGTVVTGDTSSVIITGTDEEPVLNFELEKGETGATGATGNGIASISKTSTSGLVDTYTITFTSGATTTFDVTNGNGIVSVSKTGTTDNIDTYTITFDDGSTETFTVTNSTVTDQEFEDLKNEVDYYKNMINAMPKVTDTGTTITINDTVEAPMFLILTPSILTQDNTPTPTSPENIHVITGNNTIIIANSDNTKTQTLSLNLGDLEYCKIGNYADEFYLATESDTGLVAGKWYLKKNILKTLLSSSWNWNRSGELTNLYRFYTSTGTISNCINDLCYCNYFKNDTATHIVNNDIEAITVRYNSQITLRINKTTVETLSDLEYWLDNNNIYIYSVLSDPQYILLTDTLQSQLTSIYKRTSSYLNQTKITQTNDDLSFVFVVSALYNLNNLNI